MKYNLKKIALITEIVGGIAIVISLIFVGVQFRENTKATRSATAAATVATMTSWYSNIGNNLESATEFWKFMAEPDSFSQQERYPHIMNMHGLWLSFQNSYYLAKEGTLDNRIHESLTEVLIATKNQPGFLLYWESRKSIFFPEFQDYVENIMKSGRVVSEGVYKKIDNQNLENND